jgi:hypothetical protein
LWRHASTNTQIISLLFFILFFKRAVVYRRGIKVKITTLEQLEDAKSRCKKLVTTRAVAAGTASAIPGAVAGIAADIGLLLELLPKINRAFGLDPEQVDELDEQMKQQIYVLAGNTGSHFIGKAITKEAIQSILKAFGFRAGVKAAASWVPFFGSAVGGVIGFGMMKYVGNQHVNECYELLKKIILEADQG